MSAKIPKEFQMCYEDDLEWLKSDARLEKCPRCKNTSYERWSGKDADNHERCRTWFCRACEFESGKYPSS